MSGRNQVSTDGGASWDALRWPGQLVNLPATAVTAGTPIPIFTPATGKKFRLLGYHLSLSVAGSVVFKDNTTECLRTPLLAAGVGQAAPGMGQGVLSAAANNALQLDVTASGSVSGWVAVAQE